MENVNKFLFDANEAALEVVYNGQPRTAQHGAKIGENWSLTCHSPVDCGQLVVSRQHNRFESKRFRPPLTRYRMIIDEFSPNSLESDIPSLLDDPAKQLTDAPENDGTLLLLLKINKFLFCSHQRTAPSSHP